MSKAVPPFTSWILLRNKLVFKSEDKSDHYHPGSPELKFPLLQAPVYLKRAEVFTLEEYFGGLQVLT